MKWVGYAMLWVSGFFAGAWTQAVLYSPPEPALAAEAGVVLCRENGAQLLCRDADGTRRAIFLIKWKE